MMLYQLKNDSLTQLVTGFQPLRPLFDPSQCLWDKVALEQVCLRVLRSASVSVISTLFYSHNFSTLDAIYIFFKFTAMLNKNIFLFLEGKQVYFFPQVGLSVSLFLNVISPNNSPICTSSLCLFKELIISFEFLRIIS